MDYFKTVIVTLSCLLPIIATAQPPILSGSKTAYYYDVVQIQTPAPQGYQPFYIDHVGRHGSRYISSAKSEQRVYQLLLLADQAQQLTPKGQQLLTQVMTLMKLNQNHYGELTDLGRQAIRSIGQRMWDNYPTVFTGKSIAVLSSTVPRAQESAAIFLQPFSAKYPGVKVEQQPNHQQTLLRFFDYSPAYLQYKKSHAIKQQLQSIAQTPQINAMSNAVAERIFRATFLSQLEQGAVMVNHAPIHTNDFVIALYTLYQALLSFTPQTLHDHQLDLQSYFGDDENNAFAIVVTAKDYLQIGPAFDANGIQIKIAAPLLWNIIHTADSAITGNRLAANLRFGHAETLSPLATLLEIEHTHTVADSLLTYPAVWQAATIIPMAANIQFIFYKPTDSHDISANHILVKLLLNEKEVHLPIITDHYPYYRWDKVKQFYVNKLNRLGLADNQSDQALLDAIQ
ncbi:histidine-type phosphatase [Orbaceae bacterium ESL0727]|nr:histidine-type phosphatase [Orbaceae bacterium ESL0727]